MHVKAASTYDTKYQDDIISSLSENLMRKSNTDNDIYLIGVITSEGETNAINR